MRVLIVEDNPVTSEAVRQELADMLPANQTLNCTLAQDVETAKNEVRTNKFDLIITDDNILDKPFQLNARHVSFGVDFITTIRQGVRNKETPIIFMSGHMFDNLVRKVFRFGLVAAVKKPHSRVDTGKLVVKAWEEIAASIQENRPVTSIIFHGDAARGAPSR